MLSGPEILRLLGRDPGISLDPFDPSQLGPNSYDLTLAPELVVYDMSRRRFLDPRGDNPVRRYAIPDRGIELLPSTLYLACSRERTESHGYVPQLNGKSSLGRLGIQVHQTAGFGDDGYCGKWTLEITVVHPVRVYPGMPICQVCWFPLVGERSPYAGRYQDQTETTPYRSRRFAAISNAVEDEVLDLEGN